MCNFFLQGKKTLITATIPNTSGYNVIIDKEKSLQNSFYRSTNFIMVSNYCQLTVTVLSKESDEEDLKEA